MDNFNKKIQKRMNQYKVFFEYCGITSIIIGLILMILYYLLWQNQCPPIIFLIIGITICLVVLFKSLRDKFRREIESKELESKEKKEKDKKKVIKMQDELNEREVFISKGIQMIKNGKSDEALKLFINSIYYNETDNSDILYYIGFIQYEKENFSDAVKSIEQVLKMITHNKDSKIFQYMKYPLQLTEHIEIKQVIEHMLGYSLLGDDKYDRAIEILNQALDSEKLMIENMLSKINQKPVMVISKVRMDINIGLGIAYLGKEEYSKAFDSFKSVLKLDFRNTDALYYIVAIHLKTGRIAKAIKISEKIFKIEKSSKKNWCELTHLYNEAGLFSKGLKICKKVLKNVPECPYALAYMGFSHYKNEDLETALNYIKKSISIKTNYKYSHFYLALIYLKQKQYDDALNECNMVLELDNKFDKAIKLKDEINRFIELKN